MDPEELSKFKEYCRKIGARGYWVDRWKRNKNVYVRRIRVLNMYADSIYNPFELETGIDDWSEDLRIAQKKEKENKMLL